MHNTLFCVHCSPEWFFGFDSLMETMFFFFLLIIAWYAFRVYRFTGARPFRHWSIGFVLIALAYLAQATVNYVIYHELVEAAGSMVITQTVTLVQAYNVAMLARVLFYTLGYLSLVFVALRCHEWQYIPIFTAVAISTAFASVLFPWLFELVIIMLLIYLIVLTASRGKSLRRNKTNHIVVAGFSLVLVGHISYLFTELSPLAYVIGHGFEFLGYCSLLLSLLLILRKK